MPDHDREVPVLFSAATVSDATQESAIRCRQKSRAIRSVLTDSFNSKLPFLVRSARLECGRLLASQILEEQTDGLDAAMEIGDVELLVGSVQVVVRKAESHHHAGNVKHVLKVGDDRN